MLIKKFSWTLLFFIFCNKEVKKISVEIPLEPNLPQEELSPTRWDSGDTTITNEARLDLYYPFIEGIGGVYVGVGSIQNFTLAAKARAESVYLMDFTKIVVLANKVHILFLKKAKTKEEYLSLFEKQNYPKGEEILSEGFSQKEFLEIKKVYHTASTYFRKFLSDFAKVQEKNPYPVYFNSDPDYDYLHNLANKGEITSLAGDLNGEITLQAIANDIKRRGKVIHILYLSNAEEYFPFYGNSFRKNIEALPVNGKSLLLRSLAIEKKNYPWAKGSEFLTDRGFHYNLMPVKVFQEFLTKERENFSLRLLMKKAEVISEGLSRISQENQERKL